MLLPTPILFILSIFPSFVCQNYFFNLIYHQSTQRLNSNQIILSYVYISQYMESLVSSMTYDMSFIPRNARANGFVAWLLYFKGAMNRVTIARLDPVEAFKILRTLYLLLLLLLLFIIMMYMLYTFFDLNYLLILRLLHRS